MDFLLEHGTEILAIIGGVVSVASMIVAITPSTRDDEIVGVIVKFLEKFSVFTKRTH